MFKGFFFVLKAAARHHKFPSKFHFKFPSNDTPALLTWNEFGENALAMDSSGSDLDSPLEEAGRGCGVETRPVVA